MEFFYMIVLAIAILFLIIMLTYIGILMRYTDSKVAFPPIENDCPDYWVLASDGKSCTIPLSTEKNAGSLYTSVDDLTSINIKYATIYKTVDGDNDDDTYSFPTYTPGLVYTTTTDTISGTTQRQPGSTIDFTHDAWAGSKGLTSTCAKKYWANNWKITWDGITNTNTC
jgi:hypothetical protein